MYEVEGRRLSALPHSRPGLFRLGDDILAVRIGLFLAAAVLLFAALHILTYFLYFAVDRQPGHAENIFYFFNLGNDGSLPEAFNHGMLFTSGTIFLAASYITGSRTPIFFSALVMFAWLDDFSQYHEGFGGLIAESWNIPPYFNLRSGDIGELLAWGLVALFLLPLAVWAYVGRREGDETVVHMLTPPFAALIFCGVVFDIAHIVVDFPGSGLIFTLLEDGGEMLAIAGTVAVSLGLLRNAPKIYRMHS